MTLLRSTVMLVAVAACGPGRPDVDETKRMVDLTAAEIDELCRYQVAVQDGPRQVWCADDYYTDFESFDQCRARLGNLWHECTTTVDEAETCWEALADSPCDDGPSSEACTISFGCR